MTLRVGKLWVFWGACALGSIAYGWWFALPLEQTMASPYWIAFTILCIQFLGVGRDENTKQSKGPEAG